MERSSKLAEGKVPWDLLAEKVRGALPAGVLVGPGPGEDAALVEIGGEVWAAASDPISFTAHDAGRLAVIVNANDVAVMGAEPRFFLAVVLLAPAEASRGRLEEILDQVRRACEALGVALLGGHTEVTPGLPHSMVVGTMLGRVTHRPLSSAGLRPGDAVGMTKWAGLEGTTILLAEQAERLPREILSGEPLSVVPEARLAAGIEGVSALHDVTEGGVGEALYELARASGVDIDAERGAVPLLPETRALCHDLGLDPLGLIGSGALLVGCAEDDEATLEASYAARGIPFRWIGRAVPDGEARSRLPRFPRDEILKTRMLDGIEAVIFDMDGTLVASHYDWAAIRRELGLEGVPSLIDSLNELDSPERERGWARLEEIERQATARAEVQPGAHELLELLRTKGLKTALVTNNTAENTTRLCTRFALAFDLVLTRDDGLWKPSGAPVTEAIRRLGVQAERTLKVGDTRYDVVAAREAGCARIVLVHDGSKGELGSEADLSFPELTDLLRYCRHVF